MNLVFLILANWQSECPAKNGYCKIITFRWVIIFVDLPQIFVSTKMDTSKVLEHINLELAIANENVCYQKTSSTKVRTHENKWSHSISIDKSH